LYWGKTEEWFMRMSETRNERSLLLELERTEMILQELLTRLSSLNSALEPIERDLKICDFAESGEFVQGSSKGIVCILSGLIHGDPLQKVLTEKGRGRDIPALIKAGDRSESQGTIDSIVSMIYAQDQKQSLEYVINLRWAELPSSLEGENVVIIGSRYSMTTAIRVSKLKEGLKKLGHKVLYDDGEFGGGPLVYEIVKLFGDRRNLVIIELTLTRQVVENSDSVTKILNLLAAF
jgi:hypothetical protein